MICRTCHQPIKGVKPPTVNYKMFPSFTCGIDLLWIVPAGERWKDKPYMQKHQMFPHQIKGAV